MPDNIIGDFNNIIIISWKIINFENMKHKINHKVKKYFGKIVL